MQWVSFLLDTHARALQLGQVIRRKVASRPTTSAVAPPASMSMSSCLQAEDDQAGAPGEPDDAHHTAHC